MTALLMGRAAFAAPACGDRIQGFVTFEDYDDNLRPAPGATLFTVEDYSSESGFHGLAVKKSEDRATKLEIELRDTKKGPARKTESFSLSDWDRKKGYLFATDLSGSETLSEESGFFVMRLRLNGRVLCEDQPMPIDSEGH